MSIDQMRALTTNATTSKVRALGYLGLTATDLGAWRRFATEICGLQVGSLATDDNLYLRMDERAWRISVESGDGQVSYIGWEVAGGAELDALAADLDAAGVAVEDTGLAAERHVTGLIRAKDPAGHQLEFFYGAKVDAEPFVSPRGVRFVTGDQGMGHVVLAVPDLAAAAHYYIDTLGFRISDRIQIGPETALFTHVNPRHHSLAFGGVPGGSGLHHLMLQCEDLDSVGYALDRVLAGGAELTATLGKHTNDHMTSFYMETPSACEVEYGWNGRQIDDDVWTVTTYDAASYWGHHRTAPITTE